MKNNNINNNDKYILDNKNKSEEKTQLTNNIYEVNNQFIQEIMHISNLNKNTSIMKIQNTIIKKFTSVNDLRISALEKNSCSNNFNPYIEILKQKDYLSKFNFNENNINQKELDHIIQQYNELNQKISKNLNVNLSNQNKPEYDLIEKLNIINNPLVELFEKEININEIRNTINNQYKNKFKNNTYNNNESTEIQPGINIEYIYGELNETDSSNISLNETSSIIGYSFDNSNDNNDNNNDSNSI